MPTKRLKTTIVIELDYSGRFTQKEMKDFVKDITYNRNTEYWDFGISWDLVTQDVEILSDPK